MLKINQFSKRYIGVAHMKVCYNIKKVKIKIEQKREFSL